MNTRILGKRMFFIGWAFFLIVMVFLFSRCERLQENPNQKIYQQGSAEVRLKGNKSGHYIFTGQVNGRDVDFLVDTGATTVAIPEALARKLSLKKGRSFSVSTANGVAQAWQTQIDTLQIGNITLNNIRASINPGLQGDALLGMSALNKLRWRQEDNELILRQTNSSIK